jgi:hypothetical protein
MVDRDFFQEEHAMKRTVISLVVILLVLTVAWAAFGQAGEGRRGFGQMREAQVKALTAIQENAAKLKSMMEASAKAMEGRSFQDMSEDERAKMRETFTKQREEQQTLVTAMEQDVMRLKGFRQLRTEQEEAVAPLKELLAAAQKENAKETAGKIEQMIAQRQKQFEDKMKAMGYDPAMMQRSRPQQ